MTPAEAIQLFEYNDWANAPLLACAAELPPGRLSDPARPVLRAALKEVERERSAFLHSVTADRLARPIHYTLMDGSSGTLPLATPVRHTANHSTYHRGQIASMLRRRGAAPPSTDPLVFAVGRRERVG